jgi:hypothetical protein
MGFLIPHRVFSFLPGPEYGKTTEDEYGDLLSRSSTGCPF